MSRTLAFGIDLGLLAVGVAAVNTVVSLFHRVFGVIPWFDTVATYVPLLLVPGAFVLYFAIGWSLGGMTVGNTLMGIQVLRTNGEYVSLWRSLLRLVGLFLAMLPLAIGVLWALVDKRKQGWHDKIADTCVVYTSLEELEEIDESDLI